jgi:hypothetical protein
MISPNKFDLKSLLNRPEVLTLILAVVVSAIVGLGLPEKSGLTLPHEALTTTVSAFWAVFLGAVLEGKYKGADYKGGLTALVGSTKVRLALVQLVVSSLAEFLRPLGIDIPQEAVTQVGTFILYSILGKTGFDVYQTVSKR